VRRIVNEEVSMSATTTARTPRTIPVRKGSFSFDEAPTYWCDGEPSLTHLLNALSVSFPDGERMFMEAVAHFRKDLKDPALRKEVAHFLAQEAEHAKAHEAFNAWVASRGFDLEPLYASVRERIALGKKASPQFRLAVTCALEHFTAIMAEQLLQEPDLLARFAPEMQKLWLWHAVEETEHKAVAFDVYQEVDGSYARRVLVMMLITVRFTTHVAWMKRQLMKNDPRSGGLLSNVRGAWTLWGNPGWFRKLVPAYLDYYRRDFHPWDRDTEAALERAREKLGLDRAVSTPKDEAA